MSIALLAVIHADDALNAAWENFLSDDAAPMSWLP